MSKTKYMDLKEFQQQGYLQEANRLFFHPLGLALEMTIDEDGTYSFSGIWDYRNDPEGVIFAPGVIDIQKMVNVAEENARISVTRAKCLDGKNIQEPNEQ